MNTITSTPLLLVSLTESLKRMREEAEEKLGTLTDEFLRTKERLQELEDQTQASVDLLNRLNRSAGRADKWHRDATLSQGNVSLSDDDVDAAIEAIEAEMKTIESVLASPVGEHSRGKERLKLLQKAGEKAALLMVLLAHQKI